MYEIYTTRGFILSSSPAGESNKIYYIYTKDFGLIRAVAQGVRLIKSKLKFNLEEYNYIQVSLVKGKEFWRITGALSIEEDIYVKNNMKKIRARVFSLVKRMIQGEEKNDEIFEKISTLFIQEKISKLSLKEGEKDMLDFEVKCLASILSALGYMNKNDIDNLNHKELLIAVNQSLKASQL